MLAQMLQTLYRKRSSCTLVITTATEDVDGSLYIKDGQVIAASQGTSEGIDAVTSMLSWPDPSIAIYSLPTHIASTLQVGWASPPIQLLIAQAETSTAIGIVSTPASAPLEQDARTALSEAVAANDGDSSFPLDSIPPPEFVIAHKESSVANLNETLKTVMEIEGAMSVAMVDWTSGMSLGEISNGMNIELAAAGNSNVVRAKHQVMKDLGLKDQIEDILITLGNQYHLIRLLASNPNLFIYLVLNKGQANLGMARYRLSQVEKDLVV